MRTGALSPVRNYPRKAFFRPASPPQEACPVLARASSCPWEARDQGALSLSCACRAGPWGKTWPPTSGLRGGLPVEQGAVLACTVFLGPGESSDLCLKERNETCERWERKALAQRKLLSRYENPLLAQTPCFPCSHDGFFFPFFYISFL